MLRPLTVNPVGEGESRRRARRGTEASGSSLGSVVRVAPIRTVRVAPRWNGDVSGGGGGGQLLSRPIAAPPRVVFRLEDKECDPRRPSSVRRHFIQPRLQ